MNQFKQSPVIFDEESHIYQLDGKRLLGITGLIHSILGLGVYPDVSEYVKDFVIPRAGSRGTAIHHAIQTLDLLGIYQPTQVVNTRYGCSERGNLSYKEETWEVGPQLEAYIRHRNGFMPLANELTVSDNVRYASQIDNVWQFEQTGGIWLVDTKTNNTKLYPTCGYFKQDYFPDGETALKEYLSWQLSVYAELFESENPGMKVEGLACNWLREDDAAFWVIDRKPSELVKELLSTDYLIGDNGPVFFHHDVSVFGIGKTDNSTTESADSEHGVAPMIDLDFIDEFHIILKRYKEAEAALNEAKKKLQSLMSDNNLKSYDFGDFTATIGVDSTTTSFDVKRFKSDHAALYSQYASQNKRKGSFTVKLKDND